MSISAMKQALDAITNVLAGGDFDNPYADLKEAASELRQAIAEAENQDPVAVGEEWKPCVKLPVIVHVREQRKGETHVSTREGITPVKEDDLIMRGVAGEEYPIGRELFNRTYTFDTAPVHASDISQECVDETAKDRHIAMRKTTRDEKIVNPGVYEVPVESCKEWVGLTDEDIDLYAFDEGVTDNKAPAWLVTYARGIEAKLKEKNQCEWIGLDPEMMRNTPIEFNRGALWAERWLKEKNT